MARTDRAGGSFAPPLTDEKLAAFKALAASAPGPVRDAMTTLQACVEKWWELPDSGPDGSRPHPSGRGTIVPLDGPIASALDEHIPWEHELAAYSNLFSAIDPVTQRDLRNAAFHLLWHVKELNFGREPLTADKL